MTIYTEFTIKPADSGFGMWQRGEKQVGPQTSYAYLSDLVMDGELIDLDDALADEDFIKAGIEDIAGESTTSQRIYIACSGKSATDLPACAISAWTKMKSRKIFSTKFVTTNPRPAGKPGRKELRP